MEIAHGKRKNHRSGGSGTAAAPGIAFDGDGDTGIYRPGANQVAISTNGTGRLFVDASGKIGIGTASPQELLHVTGNNSGGNFVGQIIQNTANPAAPDTSAELRLRLSSDVPNLKYAGIKAIGTASYNNKIDLAFFTLNGNNSIYISNQEQVRITGDGYLRLSSNSGGIQFNGDTAAANALDDYEEGTWTPSGISATGRYTKIGNIVTLYLAADANNNNSNPITGLPFSGTYPTGDIAGTGRYYALNTSGTTEMASGAALVVGGNLYLMPLITTLPAGAGARWFSVTVTYAVGY